MSTPEDQAPSEAAADPSDALSPAVRRLVRQFDLDITGIHGTGPAGRIRVGDVMGLLGGRTDSGNRDAPVHACASEIGAEAGEGEELPGAGVRTGAPQTATDAPGRVVVPTSTVFDCDLSRVLAHRQKLRSDNCELLTTSYFLTALAAALDMAPEITAGHPPRFGVWLATAEGELRSAFLDIATVSWDAALDERVRAVDGALRANLDADLAAANLLVHHYGESGSVLATPTPIHADHAASVGIGAMRREVVVRTVTGVEAPRLAARCYLSLSFFDDRIPLHHANRALADAVRILQSWPD
jgi:pyruvate/2-oxoglutarate dehydrogenase complex dihydrolipoamide acyltransferase (E2) component